jgi:DNA-binding NarL/FixJ family response regulator
VPHLSVAVAPLPESAGDHLASPPAARCQPRQHAPLTARQTEIARLIAEGLTNGQIANRLVLTPGTVGNHVGHILRRLGASNRAQVAAWLMRQEWDEPHVEVDGQRQRPRSERPEDSREAGGGP